MTRRQPRLHDRGTAAVPWTWCALLGRNATRTPQSAPVWGRRAPRRRAAAPSEPWAARSAVSSATRSTSSAHDRRAPGTCRCQRNTDSRPCSVERAAAGLRRPNGGRRSTAASPPAATVMTPRAPAAAPRKPVQCLDSGALRSPDANVCYAATHLAGAAAAPGRRLRRLRVDPVAVLRQLHPCR